MTTATASPVIGPCVHRNGTSRDDLLENLIKVASPLRDTIDALAAACPNGRDYYIGPHSIGEATAQHRLRLSTLQSVLASLESEMELIADAE